MPVRPVVALLAVLGVGAFGAPVRADIIKVDSLADAADAAPGDGVCHAAPGCTLRAAIETANADPPRADTIFVPAGKITLGVTGPEPQADPAATGDLDIIGRVTINGAGVARTIVDAAGKDRIFDVRPDGLALITAMTIRNGAANFGDAVGSVVGGGLRVAGNLTFDHSAIENSNAPQGGGAATEGAGMLILRTVTMSGNSAGAGPGTGGGAVAELGGRVRLEDVLVTGSSAPDGAGLLEGGGGVVDVVGATFTANAASRLGGAVLAAGGGTVNMTNATVTANSAPTGPGIAARSGAVSLHAVTMGGGADPLIDNAGATVTARDTIVSGACAGPVASGGHNLDSGDSCGFRADGDLIGTDPVLDVLRPNDGPTPTMALLSGSPAIDRGLNCPPTDQRGAVRPFPRGGQCDIGAYEFGSSTVPPGLGGTGSVFPAGSGSASAQSGNAISVTPSSRRCPSRRRFVIHIRLPRGLQPKSISVRLGKTRTFKVSGKGRVRRATVDLSGLAPGRRTVSITIRRKHGKALKTSRRYRTCTKKGQTKPVRPI